MGGEGLAIGKGPKEADIVSKKLRKTFQGSLVLTKREKGRLIWQSTSINNAGSKNQIKSRLL